MLIISPEILYNIRKKELEKMLNDIGKFGSIQRWTPSAVECYQRGCICSNCPIQEFIKSQKCQMKAAVLELVKIHGIPTKRNGPNY